MEVFLLAGIVLILTAIIVWQSLGLKRLRDEQARAAAAPKPIGVTAPTAELLEHKLTSAYEAKITEATGAFGADLSATSAKLSEQVSRLTTKVIEEELEAYQKTLEQVRATATEAMEQIHQAVERQRIELREGMEAELAAEKKLLADKFDAKMGDVVASYISEALGSGVDLGAQMQYILNSLETHKEEIRKDLLNGV